MLFRTITALLLLVGVCAATPNGTPPGLDKCHDSNGVVLNDADASAACRVYVEAEAEAKALAICGDAVAFCNGGSAFSLAVTKSACTNANIQASVTQTHCGSADQSCGDASTVCGNVAVACPAPPACPDVNVSASVLHCKRTRTLKDGTVIGKKCNVVVSDAIQPKNDGLTNRTPCAGGPCRTRVW